MFIGQLPTTIFFLWLPSFDFRWPRSLISDYHFTMDVPDHLKSPSSMIDRCQTSIKISTEKFYIYIYNLLCSKKSKTKRNAPKKFSYTWNVAIKIDWKWTRNTKYSWTKCNFVSLIFSSYVSYFNPYVTQLISFGKKHLKTFHIGNDEKKE